jgi:hypothetical protein
MGSITFGDAGRAIVASVPPRNMTVVRGENGCAMASDRM